MLNIKNAILELKFWNFIVISSKLKLKLKLKGISFKLKLKLKLKLTAISSSSCITSFCSTLK
jgi:hypothetical protein